MAQSVDIVRGRSRHSPERFRLNARRTGRVTSERSVRPRIANRIGSSENLLAKAGLLDGRSAACFASPIEAREVIHRSPPRIDVKFLQAVSRIRASFGTSTRERPTADAPAANTRTSAKRLKNCCTDSYERLKSRLSDDLLARVRQVSPARFESIVLDVLLAMGYGGFARRRTSCRSQRRRGIDGLINEDLLGLDVVYIQAKRWEGVVGRPVVQAFVGSLEGHRSRKGVLITTSSFTADATQYVGMIDKKVILIDGLVSHS